MSWVCKEHNQEEWFCVKDRGYFYHIKKYEFKNNNMSWSEQEVSEYQKINAVKLAEVNATLNPDKNLSGKVGIGLPGQAGDLMTAMSALYYREQFFPGKEIVWFANMPNIDCLKYAQISEVRAWPWPGNGLPPDAVGDYDKLVCNENNRLNKELAKNYEALADLDEMYFPAPWMLAPQKRHGIDYPNCSRKVFGIPNDYPWHPVLEFSDSELLNVYQFMTKTRTTKNILFETFAGSSQSKLTHEMVIEAIRLCKQEWPGCKIYFASHKYLREQENFPEGFFEQENVFSCSQFTVRQCGILNNHVDLIISVSSGITVACSHWGAKNTPVIQYTGSFICSTKSLAEGREFELITADNKTPEQSQNEFYYALTNLLNKYK